MSSRRLGLIAVVAIGFTFLSGPCVAADAWVYEGAIISARGPTSSRAALQAGLPSAPPNFSTHKLSDATVMVSDTAPYVRSFNAEGHESFKPYNRKNNQCKGAKVRRILKSIPGRVRCEPNYARFMTNVPNDPMYSSTYPYNSSYVSSFLSLEKAWDYSTGSKDIVVGVIDTGVLISHPDLAANIWTNPNEIAGNGIDDDKNGVIDDINGVNAITWPGFSSLAAAGNPLDDNGHGTHCAGIIGATGNNSTGVVGVNWNIRIVAAKFLDSTGSGSTANAIKALQYMTKLRQAGHKIVLTNNSWGGGGFSQALLDAIQEAGRNGLLFVAAAGNGAWQLTSDGKLQLVGQDNDKTPFYPASYDSDAVVAVASTDASGNLSSFSNYGKVSVDIAAPGSAILSTYLGNAYKALSGTSMAAPQVSGIVALAQSICPKDTLLTLAQLRNAVLTSGTQYPGVVGKVASSSIANAAGAVRAAASACAVSLPGNPPVSPTQSATPTATPTATSTVTPTVSPAPSKFSTPSPTPVPVLPTATPKSIITATATPRATATSTPRPTATSTPRPTATSTARPTATPTPTPQRSPEPSLSVSPSVNVGDGASLSLVIAGAGNQTSALLQIEGQSGNILYVCPAFAIPLKNGGTTLTGTLPTSAHRVSSLRFLAVVGRGNIRQTVSMTTPASKPDTKLDGLYMSDVCKKLRADFLPGQK